MKITKGNVVAFKEIYCNENRLIASLLRDRIASSLRDPILDVGSGMGDISAAALPNRQVVLLDVLDYSNHPIPHKHERTCADFFTYDPKQKFGSIFLCHVLQFIDDDIARLNLKLKTLDAEKIVVVSNSNDAFMGNLVDWFAHNVARSNPEIALPNFPNGYLVDDEVQFTAQLSCPDYDTLVQQVIFLMDCKLSLQEKLALKQHLHNCLREPSFPINEKIGVYKKVAQ